MTSIDDMIMNLDGMIKVMEHYRSGGLVEAKAPGDRTWFAVDTPLWSWGNQTYRIKVACPEWIMDYLDASSFSWACVGAPGDVSFGHCEPQDAGEERWYMNGTVHTMPRIVGWAGGMAKYEKGSR